jgi:hypothetical protein
MWPSWENRYVLERTFDFFEKANKGLIKKGNVITRFAIVIGTLFLKRKWSCIAFQNYGFFFFK